MNEEFHTFLRRRLTELGLTQAQVCDALGYKAPYLSAVMTGAKVPKIETMRRLCSVVGPYTIQSDKDVVIEPKNQHPAHQR